MSSEIPDITIVGGGVIGCAAAWWLSQRGAGVEVLEAAEVASGASSAAAGVLGPLAESVPPGFMTGFALDALQEIERHADGLREASGLDFGYRRSGVLRVASSDAGLQGLHEFMERRGGLGLELRRLDTAQLHEMAPGLGPDVRAGVFAPAETHVLPAAFTGALAEAARHAGARFRTGVSVTGVERQEDAVVALHTTAGRIPVAALLIAAGAEAAPLGDALDVPLPVRPVRGAMLALRPDIAFGEAPIFAESVLLTPKPEGELWVGSTYVEAGFDARLPASELAWLLNEAIALAPALQDAAFLRAWTGLRPAMPDGLPALGPLPGLRNAYAALGFFRNGILMSLLAGRIIAGLVLDNAPGREIAPLDPGRFRPN